MPRISVIIPCHNSALTLAKTIRSLRAQTMSDWEAIAIDDCSTDETLDLLNAISRTDPRVRVVSGPGKGASSARNLGLRSATSEIVAYLDSDDLWEATRLSKIIRFLTENPEVDVAYSRFAFFNTDPGDTPTVSTVPATPLSVLDLLKENLVGTMSNVVVRRASMTTIGDFREDMSHGEDREWLVRAAAKGLKISGLAETLLHYRTSMGGLSSDLALMLEGWRESVKTARTHQALPSAGKMRKAEATYLRYLARRSLRLGLAPSVATKFAIKGALKSPSGFFDNKKRGALTIGAALMSNVAPQTMRNALANR